MFLFYCFFGLCFTKVIHDLMILTNILQTITVGLTDTCLLESGIVGGGDIAPVFV